MEETILLKLQQIEWKLEQTMLATKEILTFTEFCRFCGISESYGYKLTSNRQISHFKPSGKLLYFKRSDVEKWLLSNPVPSQSDLQEATLEKLRKRREF